MIATSVARALFILGRSPMASALGRAGNGLREDQWRSPRRRLYYNFCRVHSRLRGPSKEEEKCQLFGSTSSKENQRNIALKSGKLSTRPWWMFLTFPRVIAFK